MCENTKVIAGWLVCNYVLSAACLLEYGVKRYCTARGTSQLRRHAETHECKPESSSLHKCNAHEKRLLSGGATICATLDILPISFCYRKKGFSHIAKALVELGQRHPTSTTVDVKDAFPSAQNMRDTIIKMATNVRNELKSGGIAKIAPVGGGITCDSVKIEERGRKYYEFILNFIEVQKQRCVSKVKSWRIVTRLLFIVRCDGTEIAQALCEMTKKSLEQYDTKIDELSKNFTFVTDRAATIPAVFGSSVSPNRVAYSDRWIGCVSHQLNTAMKYTFADVSDQGIRNDTENLKKLIRIFKKKRAQQEASTW